MSKEFTFKFSMDGKPENYTRERYTSRGKRFYNAKASRYGEVKQLIKEKLKDDSSFKELQSLLKDDSLEYFLELECTYFIKIPKNDSKKIKEKKLSGILRPTIRPDLDNYDKFINDVFHDVFFDDDKRIVKSCSEKRYAEEYRTDVVVKIFYNE